MTRSSPPVALLALNGHSATEIAEASGRSLTNISHLFTGRLRWNEDVEKVILEVTGDRELVGEIKAYARQAWLAKRAERAAQSGEAASR